MAKFCSNCGSQVEDGTLFCASCGAKVETAQTPAGEPKKTFKKPDLKNLDPKTKKFAFLGAIAAVVILVAVLVVSLFFGPKAVVKKYMRGMINENAKKVVNCMPSFLWEDKDEKDEAIEDYQDMLEGMYSDYDKVKFEIKDVHKLSKNERETLESYLETLEETNDKYKVGAIKVNKARIVEVKVTIKDGGDTIRKNMEILVVKYKGQWKVFPFM